MVRRDATLLVLIAAAVLSPASSLTNAPRSASFIPHSPIPAIRPHIRRSAHPTLLRMAKEPSEGIVGGVFKRISLPPVLLGIAPFPLHTYVTGPLAVHPPASLFMWLVEEGAFLSVGMLFGVLWAFQFLVVGTGVLKRSVKGSVSGVLDTVGGDKADKKAGRDLEKAVRGFIKELRNTPGWQGFILQFVLDLSGVFSEPGITRLMEDVDRRQQEGMVSARKGKTRTLSTLLSTAAEGAVLGRLDDLRLISGLLLVFGVGALDWAILGLEKMVK
uniref:Uncharacterized protein n=2 Tax=Hemiselmis andersenii TaxID=464988 RepID=A0A7S1MWF6_HEMAN|mmetsp:Transcript_60820/g.146383  ORF Transcript_60820/g.146383 Transcript_60820/m.146383 type:complete len:273 (+) Transcript_60820:49-867(+)